MKLFTLRSKSVINKFLRPKAKTNDKIYFTTLARKNQIKAYFKDFFDIVPLKVNVMSMPEGNLKKAIVKLSQKDFEELYKKLGDSLKINLGENK